jgi:hypothetical protein
VKKHPDIKVILLDKGMNLEEFNMHELSSDDDFDTFDEDLNFEGTGFGWTNLDN